MTEVEKMRSSQLADMSAPELQVRFEHAKKLLAIIRWFRVLLTKVCLTSPMRWGIRM